MPCALSIDAPIIFIFHTDVNDFIPYVLLSLTWYTNSCWDCEYHEIMYYTFLVINVHLYGTVFCEHLRVGVLGTNSSPSITDKDFDFAYLGGAVPIAFNTAKTQVSELSNYTIKTYYAATQCEAKLALDSFIKLKIEHNIDAVLGLQCRVECYVTALLASQWNVPVVSHSCTYLQVLDSTYFTTFLGTSVSNIGDAVVAIFFNFNWAHVTLVKVYETRMESDDAKLILRACRKNNIFVTSISTVNKTEQDTVQHITHGSRSKSSKWWQKGDGWCREGFFVKTYFSDLCFVRQFLA